MRERERVRGKEGQIAKDYKENKVGGKFTNLWPLSSIHVNSEERKKVSRVQKQMMFWEREKERENPPPLSATSFNAKKECLSC